MRQDRGTTVPGARRRRPDTLVLVVALAGVLAAAEWIVVDRDTWPSPDRPP